MMYETFARYGVQFRYPGWWELAEQPNDDGVSITVSSPETAFWTLSLLPGVLAPEDVVEQAVDAFRDEYDELDVYPSTAEVCRRPTAARDIDFVCLDLIGSAFLRAFRTARFTALVLYQGTDRELAETRETLERIAASLECDAPDDH